MNKLDLIELKIDRSFSAEHGNDNADAIFVRFQFVHDTQEAIQGTVRDLYRVADSIADNDLVALNAKGEEIDLATLGADDDAPVYRRHIPRADRMIDDDDIDNAVGQTVETDELAGSYQTEKSEIDGFEGLDNAAYAGTSDGDESYGDDAFDE